MTTDPAVSTPTTLHAKGPEDLLAAVPVVLGFEPQDSLVMLTFEGAHRFHARADLPRPGDAAGLDEVVHTLLSPAVQHRAGRVVFVLYTADAELARRLAERLTRSFLAAGIGVVDCLRADGGRWWAALGTRPGAPASGTAYDAVTHPFRAQAVLDGHVTLRSRAELAAGIAPDPVALAEVEAMLASALPLGETGLAALVAAALDEGRAGTAEEVAALLVALRRPRLRDQTWSRMSRERAEDHVRLWSWVLRRAPGDDAAHPAALLAFSAWLDGNGALAWCALDRCFAVQPAHALGRLVATALQQAVPPAVWRRPAS